MIPKRLIRKIPKIEVEFQYKTKRGIRVFWDFQNDIPPIDIVTTPMSQDWMQRVEKEIEVFNIWKKFNPNLPLRNLNYWHDRRFTVEINVNDLFNEDFGWRKISILVPLNYPYKMPGIGDPSTDYWFIKLLRKWTGNHPFCIPRVINIWWHKLKGKAGIAHFLHIFLVFVTIAGKKSSKLSREGYTLDLF